VSAFAALKADGSITAWGDSDSGGIIPTSSYTMNGDIFAALLIAIKLHPSFDIILATK
jgi:hypothetical protein